MTVLAARSLTLTFNKNAAFGVCAAFLAMSPFFGMKIDAGPIVLRPFDFLVMMGSAFYFAPFLARGVWPVVPMRPALLFYLSLNAYFVTNALGFGSTSVAIIDAVQAIEMVLAYIIITRSLSTQTGRKAFLSTVYWLVWIIVLATVLYHIANGSYVRYKSLEEQKLLFGFVSALMFVAVFKSRREGSLLTIFGFILAIMLTLFSGERKGWFAFAVAIMAIMSFGYLGKMKRRVLARLAVFGGAGMLLLVALVGASLQVEYVSKQFESLSFWGDVFSQEGQSQESTLSNEKRLLLMEAGFGAFAESPIVGIGAGGFPQYMASYYFASQEVQEQGMHNEYLRYASETGIIGLGLFVAIWGALIADLLLVARHRYRLDKTDQIFAIFATLCVFYAAFIQFFLSAGAATFMFVILALATTARAHETAMRAPKASFASPPLMQEIR